MSEQVEELTSEEIRPPTPEEIRPLTLEEVHEQKIVALFGAMDDFQSLLRHTPDQTEAEEAARQIGALALEVLAERTRAGTLHAMQGASLATALETASLNLGVGSEDEAILESVLTRLLAKLGWRGRK